MGNTKSGLLVLLFLSEKTRTWSVLRVDPNGLTCVMAAGDNWEALGPQIPGDPS